MPTQLSQRFEDAFVFANKLHAEQFRKGKTGVPYVAHLMSVCALVLESGGGEDEAIAALLHDAVEDQGGAETREVIRQRFGEHVASIVDGCTDSWENPKPPWRQRKERFVEGLAEAPPEVIRVVSADKLHNARAVLRDYRTLGEDLWPRFRGGRDGSLWYYRAISDALAARGDNETVRELGQVVGELERLAAAQQ